MKRIVEIIIAIAVLAGCSAEGSITPGKNGQFPVIKQNGKTAIIAHRGYWNCEGAGFQENSIASLRMAQEAGFWGSEFDVQLTSDDVVIVNHDNEIQEVPIWDNPYEVFAQMTLRNGEHPATLEEYLEQGQKCKTTMLVLELKGQKDQDREDVLWTNVVRILKDYDLFDPKRVVFITFSEYLSKRIAQEAPAFVNQYLNGDLAPDALAAAGINGIDYNYGRIIQNLDWVQASHDKGMTVNVWTVNDEETFSYFFALNIDQITTNEPLLARSLLSSRELKLKK